MGLSKSRTDSCDCSFHVWCWTVVDKRARSSSTRHCEVRKLIGDNSIQTVRGELTGGADHCATTLYAVDHRDPNHDAVIRIGGEAPGRRAHSTGRLSDHVPTRVTTTSGFDRLSTRPRLSTSETICLLSPCVQATRRMTPSGISPVVVMRQSAMSSFRTSATIIVLRVPLRPSAARARNH